MMGNAWKVEQSGTTGKNTDYKLDFSLQRSILSKVENNRFYGIKGEFIGVMWRDAVQSLFSYG